MNHKITLHLPRTTAPRQSGAVPSKRLFMLVLSIWTVAATGCFRATGIQRSPMVAEVLPETGGDSVYGLKAKAGAGDFYLGNDFIQVAIDSTVYGDPTRTPLAGAPSGGSIVDAGYILLDASYTRVSMPGNAMNRLTPVVNQDPAMQMVFDQYSASNNGNLSTITMTGGILDPYNTLRTGTSAGSPRLANVAVTHSLSVAQLDRYFTLTTTVTNNTANPLNILNIGDFLTQQGGGYSFAFPANFDYLGNALPAAAPLQAPQWGVQIPGYTDFSNPLATSVQAAMVGLLDTEPGADTVDSHCSLGFLPVDADNLLVASDPQDLLSIASSLRPAYPAPSIPNVSFPAVPARLVVGSLPAAAALAPGASLTFNRRLFIVGGTSVATNIVGGLNIQANYPNGTNGLFNLMDDYRYGDVRIRPIVDYGILTFTLSGMSQRQGPLPTEVRIERNVAAVTPPVTPAPAAVWQLQRVEYFVPNENIVTQTGLAPSTLQVRLPVGIYRMVLTSPNPDPTQPMNVQTRTQFQNLNVVASGTGVNQVGMEGPIWIQKDQTFLVSPQDSLCPDAANDANGTSNQVGPITSNSYSLHSFETREVNSPVGNLQPLRITFLGNGIPNPVMRRMRTMGSYWNPTNQTPEIAPGVIPGQYQFRGGNEMFGTGFTRLLPTQFVWLPNGGGTNNYTAYGTRGPLSALVSLPIAVSDAQNNNSHVFDIAPLGLPPSWTSFDLPGPGQGTTGGYLPSEKLASAMANGIQVVGHTEQDLQVSGPGVYANFRAEYASADLLPYQLPASLSAMNRPADMQYGYDPFVVSGRTSSLANYGTVTALFTPLPANAPMGGAMPSQNWNLADFLAQAQGQYNVVHQPRGPQGLFTLQGAPLGTNPLLLNSALGAWWTPWSQQSGPLAFGQVFGNFDALELLRGEGLGTYDPNNPTDPTVWFTEFLQVRSDWFALLNLQSPTQFTKALGLSSARFSIDTPVGLARTYLKANPFEETDPVTGALTLSSVLAALKSGAAVASTGPFLDVSVGTAGPGQLVPGPVENVTLTINLWKSDWMPVDELRVTVNGITQTPINLTANPQILTQSGADKRLYSGTITVPMAQITGGKDGWIVVEAGVALATTGVYAPVGYPEWPAIMRGIYPIAVTNPIFVKVTPGTPYTPPAQ
jgi:hypothetical protein